MFPDELFKLVLVKTISFFVNVDINKIDIQSSVMDYSIKDI